MEDEATHTMRTMREVSGKSLLQREETRLKRRKDKLNEIITEKRLERPSKQNQRQVEEVKEEDQEPKGFLPLHQHQRTELLRPKRKHKGKRCWKCGAFSHIKSFCPKIRCFFCGCKGHTKKKCLKRDLHLAIMQLKKLEEEKMKIQKYKKKALDLYKQMEFKKEGNKHIMSYNGIELALYIGDYPFDKAKRGFERPILPKWKMEKKILTDLPSKNLKISDYLPHQCGKCGEVINGHKFIDHLNVNHKGWCPAGTLINATPFRYWLLWYDDRNFTRFMQNSRNFIKADPPWIYP